MPKWPRSIRKIPRTKDPRIAHGDTMRKFYFSGTVAQIRYRFRRATGRVGTRVQGDVANSADLGQGSVHVAQRRRNHNPQILSLFNFASAGVIRSRWHKVGKAMSLGNCEQPSISAYDETATAGGPHSAAAN